MSIKRIIMLVVAVVLLVGGLFVSGSVVENMDANEIMVVQSLGGSLTFYTDSGGIKCQCFGKVTKYPKRGQFWFSEQSDQGVAKDESIQIRFIDGAHAKISGGIAWEMPVDDEHLRAIHMKYGSTEAIQQQLVRTVMEKSIYMSGPLMTSKESAAEKRTMLLQFIEDQVQKGVYRTETVSEKQKDPVSGQEKTVNIVQFVKDDKGLIARTDASSLEEFGVRTFNLSLSKIHYDDAVEKQIAEQQQLVMQVQTAMAESKTAEQRALTTEQNGKADAAKAKWEQEVIKAKEVTKAQQELEVATLQTKAAEQYKLKQVLEGQGDAERKRLVMAADGALQAKLDTYRQVQGSWADAVSRYNGNWVPSVIFGGSGSGGNGAPASGAQMLIEMLNAKTAQDLGLNLSNRKQ